jgi:cytoskeletal protein RodZ
LGVRWTDLYRRAKIEETVFELLTQQYELSKIQEAKEIPTVKTLDAAQVPEKKSSPMRLLIMAVATVFAFAAGCAWILGSAAWGGVHPKDPRKIFADEVKSEIRMSMLRGRARWRRHFPKPSQHVPDVSENGQGHDGLE